MRKDLTTAPATWLSSAPIPMRNPASILATFKGGTIKVVQFTGPHKFYRAAGWDATRGEMASAYGSWWADELVLAKIGNSIAMFDKWLPKELLKRALPAQYRGLAALCEDWNDMREMFRMELPGGEELTGLVGIAAPQPQRSTMNPAARKTPMLQGGGEQVFFKRTPSLNSVNPLWVYAEHLW